MNIALLSCIFLMAGLGMIVWSLFRGRSTDAEKEAQVQIQDLLDLESLDAVTEDESDHVEKKSRSRKAVESLAGKLARSSAAKSDDGKGIIAQVNHWLFLGGMRDNYTPEQYIAQSIIVWVVGIGGSILLVVGNLLPPFFGGILAIYALIYPIIRVRVNIKKRQVQIEREIPNFIGELYMSLTAGLNINDAIMRSARTAAEDGTGDILPREFAQARVEYTMGGKDEEQALRDIAWRCGLDSVSNLVEALVQGIRTGSDLRVTLLNYSAQAQEIWNQSMREYKNSKEPSITLAVVMAMGGGFMIFAAPLMVTLFNTLGNL